MVESKSSSPPVLSPAIRCARRSRCRLRSRGLFSGAMRLKLPVSKAGERECPFPRHYPPHCYDLASWKAWRPTTLTRRPSSAKSFDQTEDDSAVSSHDDVERHSKGGRNGFERSGGARLLASFDVRNITLPETGLFGDVDLREATVFAYRANGVLAALDRSPHSCLQRDILSPGDFRVGRCNDTYGRRPACPPASDTPRMT